MVFDNSSGESDSAVVARLEMNVDQSQLDSTRQITEAAQQLAVAMQSVARFSEQHLDFLKQSADIQKEISRATEETIRLNDQQNRQEDQQSRRRDTEQQQESRSRQDRDRERTEDEGYRQRLQQQMSEATREQLARRQVLQTQMGNDPDRIFEMLRERGLVQEDVAGGQVRHRINLPGGGGSINAGDLQNPEVMARILDQLSRSTGQDENGNFVNRLGGVTNQAGSLIQGFRAGGSMAGSMTAIQGLLRGVAENGGSMGALAGLAPYAARAVPLIGGAMAMSSVVGQTADA